MREGRVRGRKQKRNETNFQFRCINKAVSYLPAGKLSFPRVELSSLSSRVGLTFSPHTRPGGPKLQVHVNKLGFPLRFPREIPRSNY